MTALHECDEIWVFRLVSLVQNCCQFLLECAISSKRCLVFERCWSWETNFRIYRMCCQEIWDNKFVKLARKRFASKYSQRKWPYFMNFFSSKIGAIKTLLLFEISANYAQKCLILNFAHNCTFEDEATKVVVLLPFLLNKKMANPFTQRKWASFMKFFLLKLLSSKHCRFLKIQQFWLDIARCWI